MSFLENIYPDYTCLDCDEEFELDSLVAKEICSCCGSTRVIPGEEQARNEAINAEDAFREDMQIQREIRRDDGIS